MVRVWVAGKTIVTALEMLHDKALYKLTFTLRFLLLSFHFPIFPSPRSGPGREHILVYPRERIWWLYVVLYVKRTLKVDANMTGSECTVCNRSARLLNST